jgi:hypothetical protein
MSVDVAIPDRFWPAVRWACSYVFSWMLPLVASERFAEKDTYTGTVLACLTMAQKAPVAPLGLSGSFSVTRHPEVRAKRASKDERPRRLALASAPAPRPSPFEARRYRAEHLRVTGKKGRE